MRILSPTTNLLLNELVGVLSVVRLLRRGVATCRSFALDAEDPPKSTKKKKANLLKLAHRRTDTHRRGNNNGVIIGRLLMHMLTPVLRCDGSTGRGRTSCQLFRAAPTATK